MSLTHLCLTIFGLLSFAAPIARIATINLHKRLHKVSYKKRAPRAVREIKKFAAALMHTKVSIALSCGDVYRCFMVSNSEY